MPRGVASDFKNGLTVERLREVLHYEPETRVFTWLKDTGYKRLVGRIAGFRVKEYLECAIDCHSYKAHRLAWLYCHGVWPKADIDHINGNKTDNRISNLREATRSQNMMAAPKKNKNSKIRRGVRRCSQIKKFSAYITLNKKQITLGYFETISAACAAREAAEKKYFGEFTPRDS